MTAHNRWPQISSAAIVADAPPEVITCGQFQGGRLFHLPDH